MSNNHPETPTLSVYDLLGSQFAAKQTESGTGDTRHIEMIPGVQRFRAALDTEKSLPPKTARALFTLGTIVQESEHLMHTGRGESSDWMHAMVQSSLAYLFDELRTIDETCEGFRIIMNSNQGPVQVELLAPTYTGEKNIQTIDLSDKNDFPMLELPHKS